MDFGVACENCWASTRLFDGGTVLCIRCGAYLGEGSGIGTECGRCSEHEYDSAFAIGVYEKALAASILQLKRSPHVPKHLRRLCLRRVADLPLKADVIVPLPLSKKRQLERGFNQAEVLAECVGKAIGVPVSPGTLRRKLHSHRNRALMDRKGRELTVRNAFEVAERAEVNGRSVLLVDDVLTTGATASSCARAIKKKGAASVTVFTLARAL